MPFSELPPGPDPWPAPESRPLFTSAHLEVTQVCQRTPTRPQGAEWTVVHRKNACVIAARTHGGEFIVVRQERIPIRAALWEFPAGQVDESGLPTEALLRETALRELQEESGYRLAPGGELLPLGHFFSSPGFSDECIHLFLAQPVEPAPAGATPAEGEAITACRTLPAQELAGWIARGDIRDANTLAAYARLCALEQNPAAP